jgi:hypothetical protein
LTFKYNIIKFQSWHYCENKTIVDDKLIKINTKIANYSSNLLLFELKKLCWFLKQNLIRKHNLRNWEKKYRMNIKILNLTEIYIQYWSVDGKYRIYLTRLRNGVKDELLASQINSIFTVNRPILYLSCNPRCPKKSF